MLLVRSIRQQQAIGRRGRRSAVRSRQRTECCGSLAWSDRV